MHIQAIQENQQKMLKKLSINKSRHTIKKYKTAFNNFNKYLEQASIQTINTNTINDILYDYIIHLQNQYTYSNNTINQYLILIKNFIENECQIPAGKIPQLKIKKHQPHYITQTQYQIIQQHLENESTKADTPRHQKIIDTDKAIINLVYHTGLRIHEALNITIKQLTNSTTDKNNIHRIEVIGKGQKQRMVYIPPATYEILMQYIQEYQQAKQKYIFESTKAHGKPITTMTIERHFQRISNELDTIQGNDPTDENSYTTLLKPHSLRHTFTVINLEKGMPINAMQKLLGHSNITTTQIYADLTDDSISDAVAKTLI